MPFTDTIRVEASGRSPRCGVLVEFDFADGVARLHDGIGPLTTADGRLWNGIGGLGTIEGLEQALGGSAPRPTFTLSGVDPAFVRRAHNSASLVSGRDVAVLLQFMDAATETVLDAPLVVWRGFMDVMSYAASGPAQRSVTLTAEGPFTGRRRPAFALYTDRDQNARFPGDRGLEQVADLVSKTIRWPTY